MQIALPTPAAAGAFLLRNWLPALLAMALIAQTVRIEGFGIWPIRIVGLQEKYDLAIDKVREARADLKRISDAKDKQAKRTEDSIDRAERGERDAKPIADKIRSAPIPQNCETPGIDILRNEI